MKKLLFLTGLVMAAVLFACSSGKANVFTETTLRIKGKTVTVSEYTAQHYDLADIKEALERDSCIREIEKPKDAKTFGKIRFSKTWKALKWHSLSYEGTVTVIHYEKGVEVVKDGNHWFYDFKNMRSSDCDKKCFIALESVLHQGVWEPAEVKIDIANDLTFIYAYTGKKGKFEVFFFRPEAYRGIVNKIEDLYAE